MKKNKIFIASMFCASSALACSEGYEPLEFGAANTRTICTCCSKEVTVNGNEVTEVYVDETQTATEQKYVIKLTYDNEQNIISDSFKHFINSQIQSESSGTYTYDGNHNRITSKLSRSDLFGNNWASESQDQYDDNHHPIHSISTSYDSQNQLLGKSITDIAYDDDGEEIYYHTISYDESGLPTYEDNDGPEYFYEYQKNENGQAVSGQKTDEDGNVVEIYTFDEKGNRFVCSSDDEECSNPNAKYAPFGELIESYAYDTNGVKITHDKNGNLVVNKIIRRIYTLDEANQVAGKVNHFRIKYR